MKVERLLLLFTAVLFVCIPLFSQDASIDDIKPEGVEAHGIKVSEIYYCAPGSPETKVIPSTFTVEPGGRIWFQLSLPQPGGFLAALMKSDEGGWYNLFPGTPTAVKEGEYRVPYNLDNPITELQKEVGINCISADLPTDKVILGGYTFDDEGTGAFFVFYYTHERNAKVEAILETAESMGKDIPRIKGMWPGLSLEESNRRITEPLFYHGGITMKKRQRKIKKQPGPAPGL